MLTKTIKLTTTANILGAAASALCLVHCLITPLLFTVHTAHQHGHGSSPVWWGLLDMLFIGISFLAVFWSVKNTSKNWMKYALWISWILLAGIIVNEKIQIMMLAEVLIYIPSMALVVLHLYNRNYCQCSDESCCAHTDLSTKSK